MARTEKVSWQNLAVSLALLLLFVVSFYAARPRQYISQNAPVFLMSEEIKVGEAGKPAALTVVAQKTAVKAAVITAPAPQPNAAPLPIIPPSVANRVLPAYPAAELAKGTAGAVLLSVYVSMTGKPEKIVTNTSSGSPDLDAAASRAVAQWRFNPATQGGQPLPCWFEVPVKFVIK